MRKEAIQPVGIGITRDGKTAFVALGPANRVAVINAATYEVQKYLLVGQRVWQMAFTPDEKLLFVTNGVSNDVSVIDVAAQRVIKSIQVGELPGASPSRSSGIRRACEAPDTAALSVEGLSHAYGARRALHDVTFAIAPATFTVLLGLNGAGKSTLFSLVTRLFGTQRGAIRIFGHDVARAPGEALRLLGVVFQPRTLDLDLSVVQNLTYHAALHGIGAREARARADAVLGRIGLADRAQRQGARPVRRPDAADRDRRARCCTSRAAAARRADRRARHQVARRHSRSCARALVAEERVIACCGRPT